ncbi:NAD(P)-dependent oxidoreductase [Candidatus Poribacteria bacterium]|nr:NAD(P)-dependent oxidoreductase [Candidatus Poribacteria bacterium]
MKQRILITGAAGTVGTTLWQAWEKQDKYNLTLTDINTIEGSKSRVVEADIRDFSAMNDLCADQDVLVHLAYLRQDSPGRDPAVVNDISASMNLFEAAREGGVKKIVYASTNHASGWNERLSSPPGFSTGDQFRPDGWYGAMKGMAEIAGRYLVDAYGMRFISFRIGTYSGTYEPNGLRHCSTLLTPRDCVQLFSLAVDYDGSVTYLITYGRSANTDGYQHSFLDISGAVEVLGYKPKDNLIKTHLHKFLQSE